MSRIELLPGPFTMDEVTCKCGCGYSHIDTIFVRKLIAARYIAATPFEITSWCRCPEHNKAVGGAPNSSHLKGEAVDIHVIDSNQRFWMLRSLVFAGFNRIGIGEDFIHVDMASLNPAFKLWLY